MIPKNPSLGKAITEEIIGLTQEINPTGGKIRVISIIGNSISLFFPDGLQAVIQTNVDSNEADIQIKMEIPKLS